MADETMSAKGGTRTVDAGLFLLRVGTGVSLALLFGRPKLRDWWTYLHTGKWAFVAFNERIGLPFPAIAASLQTVNESLGALLVACGLLTRYAAAALAFGFVVATACSVKAGEVSWVSAMYFALIFAALTLTGPGAFAVDSLRESRRGQTLPRASVR